MRCRAADVSDQFRVVEADFPMSYVAVLACIAQLERNGRALPIASEVADRVGIARPTLSKILRALSDDRIGASRIGEARPQGARPSLKLIEKLTDPADHRLVRLRLTAKGRSLLGRLTDILDEHHGSESPKPN